MSKSNKKTEFEIVGIFTGKKQETQTGLSSDLSENTMFNGLWFSTKGQNTKKRTCNKDKHFLQILLKKWKML